jgi:hypothetical protein
LQVVEENRGEEMKTVIEIITDHLKSIGADGLACDGCGCFIDNLCACERFSFGSDCLPGVKHVVTKEDHEADNYRECEIGEVVCVPMEGEKK